MSNIDKNKEGNKQPIDQIETHDDSSPFEMTISLAVLDDLGIRLYSNVPAVLSEIVANAWDADAELVEITLDWDNDQIIIKDTGHGMTEEDINRKYLTVGYKRRREEPGLTEKGRQPMGRKGIGKLSVFSIADTVEIHTIRDGQKSALRMNAKDIRKFIIKGNNKKYKPKKLTQKGVNFKTGTRIILSNLKKNITALTDKGLRKRIARRFSMIGLDKDFIVKINKNEITPKDRDYYHLLEFLWFFGEESEHFADRCPNLTKKFPLENEIEIGEKKYKIKGWIGTVEKSGNLDDETRTIVIFANKKLVHEDVLVDLSETGVYSSFLIGEIDADFMDDDDKEDIITSARQSVRQDSERYLELKEHVRKSLKIIQKNWTDLRQKEGAKKLLERPTIKKWHGHLKGDQRVLARKLLGKIDSLGLPDERSLMEMVRSTILAFERFELEERLSVLEGFETPEDFDALSKLFVDINEIEKVHYYEIARGRVSQIETFQEIIDTDKKEAIIQDHLFKFPWLLDPAWEMASGTAHKEERITKEFKKIEAKELTEDERKGRVDIRYMEQSGEHVIVELKRFSVNPSAHELSEQIHKYATALKKCLKEKFPTENERNAPIRCVCVLGKTPKDGRKYTQELLRVNNGTFTTYDELIERAKRSYNEYISRQKDISRIISTLTKLEQDFDLPG